MQPIVALVTTAVLSGCAGSPTSGPTPSPTASGQTSSTTHVDAFTALAPPSGLTLPGIDPVLVTRALETSRGLLASSLAEPGTLDGTGTATLLESLQVPDPDLSVAGLFRPSPTQKALAIRPLFAPTVQLGSPLVHVVRSTYRAQQVTGLGGESGIRITWDGSVRYRVAVAGAAHEVAYALTLSYVFGPIENEPNGQRLVQVVPGSFHAAPVVTACLAKGVLLPAPGAPTTADFAPGPWPTPTAGPSCPV